MRLASLDAILYVCPSLGSAGMSDWCSSAVSQSELRWPAAACEAGELLVEELDRLVAIDGRTTCQVVCGGASASAKRLVVAGAAGVANDDRLVFGRRLLARRHDIGQPVDAQVPPLVVMRPN